MTTRHAVIDTTVIEAAIREALRSRGLAVDPVPPSDRRNPATSVLGTSVSAALRRAGVKVVTTGRLVDEAFDRVEARLPGGDQALLNRIEASLWDQLAEAIDATPIEADEADARSALGEAAAEAVRAYDADVLVTTDPDQLRRGAGLARPVVVRPGDWLRTADECVRAHRRPSAR